MKDLGLTVNQYLTLDFFIETELRLRLDPEDTLYIKSYEVENAVRLSKVEALNCIETLKHKELIFAKFVPKEQSSYNIWEVKFTLKMRNCYKNISSEAKTRWFYSRRVVKEYKLTNNEYFVLRILESLCKYNKQKNAGACSVNDRYLAKSLNISKRAVASLIRKLEKKDLIFRLRYIAMYENGKSRCIRTFVVLETASIYSEAIREYNKDVGDWGRFYAKCSLKALDRWIYRLTRKQVEVHVERIMKKMNLRGL